MRYLIISDIHANLTAFEAVLKDAEGEWDQLWCLGDVVGYGPDPNECVALLSQQEPLSLSGNHDWAVLGKLDINSFNSEARKAIAWTQEQLAEDSRAYLAALPPMANPSPLLTLAHASPRHPVWEYILDLETARVNFDYFKTPYCLVGHTHVPMIYELNPQSVIARRPVYNMPISLAEGEHRLIINPGSVGQPRDTDPRAAYAILDVEEMTWEEHRVAYAVEETQARMRAHGLSERLILRLGFGW